LDFIYRRGDGEKWISVSMACPGDVLSVMKNDIGLKKSIAKVKEKKLEKFVAQPVNFARWQRRWLN
jgi:hypothetical protein